MSRQENIKKNVLHGKKSVEQNWRAPVFLSVIIIVTAIVYSPSFNGDFLNWDDDSMIIDNPSVKSLAVENIGEIFTTTSLNSYNPLVLLVFAVEYSIYGLNPKPFHTVNIVLHVLNSLLVFWLILLLCRNDLIALVSAILFSVHPMRVEAVSWVTSLKELLYSFFYLLSLITFTYHLIKKKGLQFYLISFILFILAVLSKPVAVTLPAVLILIDFYFNGKFEIKSLVNKIPFFVVSIVFSVITVITFQKGELVSSEYTALDNIFIFFYSLFFYLYKLILPIDLSPIYPRPEQTGGLLPFIYMISPLIIIGITFIIYRYGRKYRELVFGSLFFLVTILPVSNLIPVNNNSLLYDRFSYLPYLGLVFTFSWLVYKIYSGQILKQYATWVIPGVLLIVLALSVLCFRRAEVWSHNRSLWGDMIEKYPDEPKGYFNLGESFYKEKDLNPAVANYTKAISLDPDNVFFYNDRGNAYRELKDFDKAHADYNNALMIKPNDHVVYNNKGIAFGYQNELDSALACFKKALEISPNYTNAQINIGNHYYNSKNYDSALTAYEAALKTDDKNPLVYLSLGLTHYNKQDLPKAIENFNKVIKLDPDFESAYQKLALTYYMNKEYNNAWDIIYAMMKKKYVIDGGFMEMLKKESGRKY